LIDDKENNFEISKLIAGKRESGRYSKNLNFKGER